MKELEDVLQHWGIKGMKWGVRRDRNRPGGADGVVESTKAEKPKGKMRQKLDSMKRERQWNSVLKNLDKLSTKDINLLKKRVSLENDLKGLSKSKIAQPKDKQDYLNRHKMTNEELSRKVTRLRAKASLYKAVREASKEQREFGERVINIGGGIALKYAKNRKAIDPKDIFDTIKNPKPIKDELKKTALDRVMSKIEESNKKRQSNP